VQQPAHGLELQAGFAPAALYDAGGDLAPEAAQLRERLLSLFDAVEWIGRVLILWRVRPLRASLIGACTDAG
jgi:hypothetical protein